jgi:hypothetical protein
LLVFEDPIELYFPAAGEEYDAKFHQIVLDGHGDGSGIVRAERPGLRFRGECLIKAEVVV